METEMPEDEQVIQGTGLVLNFMDVAVPTPIELLPHCCFRRASKEEIQSFRDAILGTAPWNVCEQLESAPPEAPGKPWRVLASEHWRYWVIETTVSDGLHDVSAASRLSDIELPCQYIGINLPRPGRMSAHVALSSDIFCHFSPVGIPRPRVLDQATVNQIRRIGQGLKKIGSSFRPIIRAVEMYCQLDRMGGTIKETYSLFPRSPQAPLYALGVFAVIESLLTHDPQGGYDSLTHQIKKKMCLLNTRFMRPLDYSVFGNTSSETVWSKLYALRSDIAHGQEPSFDRVLSVLKDERTAVTFLDEAAKAVLRHALEEPQLISDLRAC